MKKNPGRNVGFSSPRAWCGWWPHGDNIPVDKDLCPSGTRLLLCLPHHLKPTFSNCIPGMTILLSYWLQILWDLYFLCFYSPISCRLLLGTKNFQVAPLGSLLSRCSLVLEHDDVNAVDSLQASLIPHQLHLFIHTSILGLEGTLKNIINLTLLTGFLIHVVILKPQLKTKTEILSSNSSFLVS